MPTHDEAERFRKDYEQLTREQRDVFEMTWADDGRATFEYGNAVRAGEVHIVWRRIGDHGVFNEP